MSTFIRNLHLSVEAEGENEADDTIRAIVSAIAESDALPTGVIATVPHIEPDWLDDMADMTQTDHVEVRWTARDERGRILFNSDTVLSADQAVGMFRGIGEAS